MVVVNEGIAKNLSTTSLKSDAYAFITDQQGLMASFSIEGIADGILQGVRVARQQLAADGTVVGTPQVDPGLQARIDQAVQNNEPLNYDELLNEVRGLRRDSAVGTVSILGGA